MKKKLLTLMVALLGLGGVAFADAYQPTDETETIVLYKDNIKTNDWLSTTTEDWYGTDESPKTCGDYTGVFYNMSKSDRQLNITVKGVLKFEVLVYNGTSGRSYTVKVGDSEMKTITHGGNKVESSGEIETGTIDEVTITLAGGTSKSASVYPVAIKLTKAATDEPTISANPASTTIKVLESGKTSTQEITVSGKNLTGSTLSATLKDKVDGLSVALTENTITEGVISTTATLTYNPTTDAKGTTTLTLTDGTTSKEVTINYIAKLTYATLETISEATTWDFANDATGSVTFDDTNKEYIYVDIPDFEDVTFAETFNAKALAFTGTYPVRGGFAQDCILRFNTSVPGELTVTFSNTGGNNNNRYVTVNGVKGEKEAVGTTQNEETFNVEVGDVTINGKGNNALRFYKLVFTPSVTEIEVTIDNGTGYRTFASEYALDFTNVTDLEAYTAKVSGDDVSFDKVEGVVKAGEGLLLKGSDNTYTIPVATDDTDGATSALEGVTTEGQKATTGDFVLMNEGGVAGFYRVAKEKFNLGKNTAYLKAEVAQAAASISYIAIPGVGGDGTTSLKAIENKVTEDGKLYDLQGRQVTNPAKGLYIKNGKKYIVK